MLHIARVVTFVHRLDQLIVSGDHLDGFFANICVVQIIEGCLEAVVEIAYIEVIISKLI